MHLSVLTLGELRRGVVKKEARSPGTTESLRQWIAELEQTFADRILPVDADIARIWGEITVRRTFPVADAIIAATAIHHNLTLVTRNSKDVQDLPVRLHNPWLA